MSTKDQLLQAIADWIAKNIKSEFQIDLKIFENFLEKEIIPKYFPTFNYIDIIQTETGYGAEWRIYISNTTIPFHLYAENFGGTYEFDTNSKFNYLFRNYLIRKQLVCMGAVATITGVNAFYVR